jgi:hypothetical protein
MDEGKKLPYVLDPTGHYHCDRTGGHLYAVQSMNNSFPKVKGKSILGSPFAFPDVWQTVSWNSTLTFIIPAILIITLTTNEFTYKTHRQNIIDGWSREQFIGVKLIEVVLLSPAEHGGGIPDHAGLWLFWQYGAGWRVYLGGFSVYPLLLCADVVLFHDRLPVSVIDQTCGLAISVS